MKLLACIVLAIFAVSATDKDALVEDFQSRCLLLGSAFTRLTSMFSCLSGGNQQQQVTYPPVYYEEPVYWYYPVYDNQEIIYEYYPGTEYFYTYPPYQYQVWEEPQFGYEQPIYYYNRMMPNGQMKKEQVSQNFYGEMKRRNAVMEKRQIDRAVINYSQLPQQPTWEQVQYDQKYEEYPRSEQQEVVYQRPTQQEQVVYRPAQTYESQQVVYRPEQEQVVYRPAQTYESQQVVYRPAQTYESQQVVYRPAVQPVAQPARIAVVGVQQKTSPMQSLFGFGSKTQQQPILVSGQQAKTLAARSQ